MKNLKEQLYDAIKKKALGYKTTESVEEFALSEGEMIQMKKKVTTKAVPPDIAAIRYLLDEQINDYENMTEEEMQREKTRLLKLLKEAENAINSDKAQSKM